MHVIFYTKFLTFSSTEAKEYHSYERPAREEVVIQEVTEPQQAPVYELVTTKILAHEDIEPGTESDSEEEIKQDRVS